MIIAVYRHHWFAFFRIWAIGVFAVVTIVGAILILTSSAGSDSSVRVAAMIGSALAAVAIGLGTSIPAYLKSQEQLVLTDESLLQILQPSLMGSKLSQLSLQHVADVSVRKDFFGSLFGYGSVVIETPGEQKNYEFPTTPNPDKAVKDIIEAHENFVAALESGRLPTNLRQAQGRPSISGGQVQLSPEEYQEFLAFQQARQQYLSQQPMPSTQPPANGSQASQQPNQPGVAQYTPPNWPQQP